MAGILDTSQTYAATWEYVKPETANAAFDSAVACGYLKNRGAIRIEGGDKVVCHTTLGGPAVHKHMARGEQANLDSQKIMGHPEFEWREHLGLLRFEHMDLEINRGKYQQVNLFEEQRTNMIDAVGDDMEKSFFGVKENDELAGSSDTEYPVDIYTICSDQTSSVGGVSVTDWPRWKPGYVKDTGSTRPTLSEIQYMLIKLKSRRRGMPKVVMCDTEGFHWLYEIIDDRVRQDQGSMTELGYDGFRFQGCDFLHVPHPAIQRGAGLSGGDPEHKYIFLPIDPKHVFVVMHRRRFMTISPKIMQAGITADIYHVETQYCFGTNNREGIGAMWADHNASAPS